MSLSSDASLVKHLASLAANGQMLSDEEKAAFDDAADRIGDQGIGIVGYREVDGVRFAILGPGADVPWEG